MIVLVTLKGYTAASYLFLTGLQLPFVLSLQILVMVRVVHSVLHKGLSVTILLLLLPTDQIVVLS